MDAELELSVDDAELFDAVLVGGILGEKHVAVKFSPPPQNLCICFHLSVMRIT